MSFFRVIGTIFIAATLSACASGPIGGGTLFEAKLEPKLQDKTQYKNLIIATVNYGKPSRNYLEEYEPLIDGYVEAALVKAGYNILPSSLFASAWQDAVRKWGSPYDETTGRLNQAFNYAVAETIKALNESTEVDAIVFTNLMEQQVYFSPTGSHTTHFLGVTRKPSTKGGDGITADFDWIQAVDAVGLYIWTLDAEDFSLLFNGAGGIEVTETLDLKPATPRWVRTKRVLDNETYIEEGLELALHPWIPSKRIKIKK